jgi:hypothetical protein
MEADAKYRISDLTAHCMRKELLKKLGREKEI